ncbi:MAG: helix-hairpin-helix domain-containing protein [Caldilineaceae bacterium]
MQTLETIKSRSQASFASLRERVQERPDEVKTWGVTAGGAVVGAVALNTVTSGVLAILSALATPPVALTVGAVGGGYLGWNYMHNRLAAESGVTLADDPVVETIPVEVPAASALSALDEAVLVDESIVVDAPAAPLVTSQADSAAAPPTEAEPVVDESIVMESAVVTASATPDDLEAINGIGPVYAGRLHDAGIQTFAQLAELSPDQIREIIGPIRSGHMIDPEKWIAEARQLAA